MTPKSSIVAFLGAWFFLLCCTKSIVTVVGVKEGAPGDWRGDLCCKFHEGVDGNAPGGYGPSTLVHHGSNGETYTVLGVCTCDGPGEECGHDGNSRTIKAVTNYGVQSCATMILNDCLCNCGCRVDGVWQTESKHCQFQADSGSFCLALEHAGGAIAFVNSLQPALSQSTHLIICGYTAHCFEAAGITQMIMQQYPWLQIAPHAVAPWMWGIDSANNGINFGHQINWNVLQSATMTGNNHGRGSHAFASRPGSLGNNRGHGSLGVSKTYASRPGLVGKPSHNAGKGKNQLKKLKDDAGQQSASNFFTTNSRGPPPPPPGGASGSGFCV